MLRLTGNVASATTTGTIGDDTLNEALEDCYARSDQRHDDTIALPRVPQPGPEVADRPVLVVTTAPSGLGAC